MPLTTQDTKTLARNAQENVKNIERSRLRLEAILKILAAGELPAGVRADDIGKPSGSEPSPQP